MFLTYTILKNKIKKSIAQLLILIEVITIKNEKHKLYFNIITHLMVNTKKKSLRSKTNSKPKS